MSSSSTTSTASLLKAKGRMMVVGAATDPIEVDTGQLLFGTRGLQGSLTGSPIDEEDTLAFSVLQNTRPMIETMKLEQAAEAYGRMMRGDARFQMVLVMGQ
jgi:D-arabinose 1-dehydrogenase-like Zn-dependent alcohol dehydrogenase